MTYGRDPQRRNPLSGNPFQQDPADKGNGQGNSSNPNGNKGDGPNAGRPWWRNTVIWVLMLAVLVAGVFFFVNRNNRNTPVITTEQGIALLQGKSAKGAPKNAPKYTIRYVKVSNGISPNVEIWLDQDYKVNVYNPNSPDRSIRNKNYGKTVKFYFVSGQTQQILDIVQNAKAQHGFDSTTVTENNFWAVLITSVLPLVLLFVAMWWLFRRMGDGTGEMFGLGSPKNKKLLEGEVPQTRFSDVAGEEAAVQEVEEIRDFLKDPGKYRKLGARIPRGVLLYGQPGTGKTLLARAIAGEAGAPFYSMAGSDFVEMFVGLGASRVRDLFEEAKKTAPAIIFIDEIDAVGRRRGSSASGGVDEREQTLNQLLVEMDGFKNDTDLIVIAATNRPDVLDPALMRPGRFDRQVAVEAPDLAGREAILKVHAKGKPFVPDVDLHTVAVRTPGFTGADLANVLNEAALLTARSNADLIDNRAIDEAIDRVMSGPRRRSNGMALRELRNTAYHEGGHAMVAAALHHTDPVTKVTILPRGRALGYTAVMPTEDRYSQTRNELLDQLAYAMGGRAAEEVVFHDPSTGASNDIEHATQIARAMVLEYGFSSKLGSVKWEDSQQEGGLEDLKDRRLSDETARTIDEEVRQLIETAHTEAWKIISENRDVLDELVRQLLVKETLNREELDEVFKGLKKAPERELWLSDSSRPDSDLPPVPIPENLRSSVAVDATSGSAGTAGSSNGAGTDTSAPAQGAEPSAGHTQGVQGSQDPAQVQQGQGQDQQLPAGGPVQGQAPVQDGQYPNTEAGTPVQPAPSLQMPPLPQPGQAPWGSQQQAGEAQPDNNGDNGDNGDGPYPDTQQHDPENREGGASEDAGQQPAS